MKEKREIIEELVIEQEIKGYLKSEMLYRGTNIRYNRQHLITYIEDKLSDDITLSSIRYQVPSIIELYKITELENGKARIYEFIDETDQELYEEISKYIEVEDMGGRVRAIHEGVETEFTCKYFKINLHESGGSKLVTKKTTESTSTYITRLYKEIEEYIFYRNPIKEGIMNVVKAYTEVMSQVGDQRKLGI